MERYKKYVLYLLPLCLNGNIILNIILRILGIGKDSVFRLLFVYGLLFIISISFILFIEYRKVVKEGLIGFTTQYKLEAIKKNNECVFCINTSIRCYLFGLCPNVSARI